MRLWRLLLWVSVGVLVVVGIAPILKMLFISLLSWSDHGIALDILTNTSLLRTLLFA